MRMQQLIDVLELAVLFDELQLSSPILWLSWMGDSSTFNVGEGLSLMYLVNDDGSSYINS